VTAQEKHPKKSYRKPTLREYGDLRRLTETDLAGGGHPDGASYGMTLTKTSG
jgi:hypothetical protein